MSVDTLSINPAHGKWETANARSLASLVTPTVLPKQKLALLDNSNAPASAEPANAHANALEAPQAAGLAVPRPGEQNNGAGRQLVQPVYQLNELLNFTCISGPSRPGANLSWLLNGHQLAALQPLGPAASRPDWFQVERELRPLAGGLVESRSTLSLRLRVDHLRALQRLQQQQQQQALAAGASGQRQGRAPTSSIWPIRLSCLARLMVEFSSETSILVAGARPAPASPLASSLIDSDDQLTPPDQLGPRTRAREPVASKEQWEGASASGHSFRWPPMSGGRTNEAYRPSEALAEAWSTPSQREQLAPANNDPAEARRRARVRQQHQQQQLNVVWTQRQLRAQAEHIGHLLARSRPNELEAPHIEADAVRRMRPEAGAASNSLRPTLTPEPTTGVEGEPDLGSAEGGESAEGERDEEGAREASSPSIVITSQQLGAASDGEPGARQLDELVNFTCHSARAGQRAGQALHRLRFKWSINNQEVSLPNPAWLRLTRCFSFRLQIANQTNSISNADPGQPRERLQRARRLSSDGQK